LRYRICGVCFDSAEPFPELTPSPHAASSANLQLRRVADLGVAGPPIRPAVTWTLPDGRQTLVANKTPNGYLLQFLDLANFFIDNVGGEILYNSRPGVPEHSVRHLILDSVIAFALSLHGRAVFHASAVVTPYGACAFAASSGVGKSTLAASFQKAGSPTLTDDCLLLESEAGCIYGVPSYPNFRLREDSLSLVKARADRTLPVAHYNSKRRLKTGGFAVGRHRLVALYCIERPRVEDGSVREPSIEMITGTARFMLALRFMFCLDPHDPEMLVRQFKLIEQVLSFVPILRLVIPDDFAALPRVHQAVLSDLKARGEHPLAHTP
jgi:hypothetical protein